jgi:hypothetical protein
MTLLTVLVFLISSSVAIASKAESSALEAKPLNNAIRQISSLETRDINEKNRKFAQNLCLSVLSARNATGEDIPTLIRNEFAKFLNINPSDADYQSKVTTFWNDNQNDFICSGKINTQYRESEHLLKRMINLNEESNFFYNFLLDDMNVRVNAVEYVNGEPETVIDFIDKIVSDPQSSRYYSIVKLTKLKKMLIDYYGAKRAHDLN